MNNSDIEFSTYRIFSESIPVKGVYIIIAIKDFTLLKIFSKFVPVKGAWIVIAIKDFTNELYLFSSEWKCSAIWFIIENFIMR